MENSSLMPIPSSNTIAIDKNTLHIADIQLCCKCWLLQQAAALGWCCLDLELDAEGCSHPGSVIATLKPFGPTSTAVSVRPAENPFERTALLE